VLWALQRHLIYLPYGDAGEPAAAGVPEAAEVTVATDDGLELGAWHVPARGETRGTVLFLPGNAGNRSMRAPVAARLADEGLATLLVDYRGYGGNPGRPSEEGLRADALAAREWLDDRDDTGPVIYLGESLGGAVAVDLARRNAPAVLVLRSPFTSLADVGRVHYPWLPVGLLLRDRYPSADRVDAVDAPVLVVAGGEDRIIPPEQSRALYEAASEPKQLVVLPGLDHNDRELFVGRDVMGAITGFIDTHLDG
jgi:uncharacterized protein